MAESTPPPPKSGGSGPIIIAAILMLLLIGGLIVWKVTGTSEPPKQDKPVTSAPAAAPILEEAPPPPPPPPVEEDAGKPEEKKVVKAAGPSGCAKECTGSASGGLQSALSGRAAQSRGCYETALRNNATLEGTLTVAVKVGPGGQVCSARVVNDGLHDPGVANCVINKFAGSQLPAPQGGCAEVNVPLRFMPKR